MRSTLQFAFILVVSMVTLERPVAAQWMIPTAASVPQQGGSGYWVPVAVADPESAQSSVAVHLGDEGAAAPRVDNSDLANRGGCSCPSCVARRGCDSRAGCDSRIGWGIRGGCGGGIACGCARCRGL